MPEDAGRNGTNSHFMWTPWEGPGLEHLSLYKDGSGFTADGLIIGVKEDAPFRVRYQVDCDAQWRVSSVMFMRLDESNWRVTLQSDGQGRWVDERGSPITMLQGCTDIDISLTPFTNTLPIRRLGLRLGEAADIAVAYFDVLETQWLSREMQRYTCLERTPEGGLYQFESNGFTARLPVDSDGIVLDYPGLFRRVWSS